MQNQVLAKAWTPIKGDETKSTADSGNRPASTTTITTIAKIDLHWEKEVNVQQEEEEKKAKSGKEQRDIMKIPTDE